MAYLVDDSTVRAYAVPRRRDLADYDHLVPIIRGLAITRVTLHRVNTAYLDEYFPRFLDVLRSASRGAAWQEIAQ